MKPLSLKMRAISLLSRREHSVLELRRKLLRIAREAQRKVAMASSADGYSDDAPGAALAMAVGSAFEPAIKPAIEPAIEPAFEAALESALDPALEVDELLVWLQAEGYLDETRFIESRVHAREQRFGSLRIKRELAQHGLALSAEGQAALRATELERAQALWARKFQGVAADDPAARARQSRFLMARGFAPDVISRLLRGRGASARD